MVISPTQHKHYYNEITHAWACTRSLSVSLLRLTDQMLNYYRGRKDIMSI